MFRGIPRCRDCVPVVFGDVPGCSGYVPGFRDTHTELRAE